MPTAVIVSQGDEVVTGQTIDTNAAWLATQLTDLGVSVVRHVTVGDDAPAIGEALADAAARADVVICTGGLGPTDDDLTAEAVAATFDAPLQLDEAALAHIQALFAAYGRPMAPSNRKQALLPTGATRLDNPRGTAPGFALEVQGSLIACMPGVPREMMPMFAEQVLPRLTARHAITPGRLVVLRTTGVGESDLQDRIGRFTHPDAVLATRTALGENQIKLRFRPGTSAATIDAVTRDVADRIGSPLFAIDVPGEPTEALAPVIGQALVEQGATLSVAESCTGGRVAALCTAVPGASAWFLEGVVAYDNEVKVRRLGVPAEVLEAHGAVSEPVARAMAEGVRAAARTTYGLATTGIAGPSGGSEAKPVGTVDLALAHPAGTLYRRIRLAGDRRRIQVLSAHAVLDLLRRHLQGLLPV